MPLFEEVLRLDKGRLGADDPKTIADMQNLAVAYRAAGRLPEALPMLEQAARGHEVPARPRPSRDALRRDGTSA